MKIKRGRRCIVKRVEPSSGGVHMLSLNHAYIIKEDMVEEFLKMKPNKEKLAKILDKANKIEKNIRNRE